jgi:hypothetical protein
VALEFVRLNRELLHGIRSFVEAAGGQEL